MQPFSLIDGEVVEYNNLYTESDFNKVNDFVTKSLDTDISFANTEEPVRRTVRNSSLIYQPLKKVLKNVALQQLHSLLVLYYIVSFVFTLPQTATFLKVTCIFILILIYLSK